MGQPPTFSKKAPSVTKPNYAFLKGRSIKVVLVGENSVGKDEYLFDVLGIPDEGRENARVALVDKGCGKVNMCEAQTNLWCTMGGSDYDRLRPLSYPGTQLFVIMYSADSKASLEAVQSKWAKEVQHHQPGVPMVLLGTRYVNQEEQDGKTKPEVSKEEAKSLAKQLGISGVFFTGVDSKEEAQAAFKEILGHYGGLAKGQSAGLSKK